MRPRFCFFFLEPLRTPRVYLFVALSEISLHTHTHIHLLSPPQNVFGVLFLRGTAGLPSATIAARAANGTLRLTQVEAETRTAKRDQQLVTILEFSFFLTKLPSETEARFGINESRICIDIVHSS